MYEKKWRSTPHITGDLWLYNAQWLKVSLSTLKSRDSLTLQCSTSKSVAQCTLETTNFKTWSNCTQEHFNKNVKTIRFHNALKFNYFTLYDSHGIDHQKSYVETPCQPHNSQTELLRKNKTYKIKLPCCLWEDSD